MKGLTLDSDDAMQRNIAAPATLLSRKNVNVSFIHCSFHLEGSVRTELQKYQPQVIALIIANSSIEDLQN